MYSNLENVRTLYLLTTRLFLGEITIFRFFKNLKYTSYTFKTLNNYNNNKKLSDGEDWR